MQTHDLWQELAAQAHPKRGDQYGHIVNRPSKTPQGIANHKAPEQHGKKPKMPIPPSEQTDWIKVSRRCHHNKTENEVGHEDVQHLLPDHSNERGNAPRG